MISPAIDIDLLRAFVAACRLGSLSRAAAALGRTQSAMSMQMRRLEELVSRPLLRRTGRGVAPTPEGEMFLGYAIRILALGDEAASRLREPALEGAVRVGLPEEIAIASLSTALGCFRRAHEGVRLEVRIANSADLEPLWRSEQLDVMVASPSVTPAEALATWTVGLRWVCGMSYTPSSARPLDLVAFAESCGWRRRMAELLAARDLAHRISFTGSSVAAVRAAIENGFGVSLLTPELIDCRSMRLAHAALGLPDPVLVRYGLYARATGGPAVAAVAEALQSARGAL